MSLFHAARHRSLSKVGRTVLMGRRNSCQLAVIHRVAVSPLLWLRCLKNMKSYDRQADK